MKLRALIPIFVAVAGLAVTTMADVSVSFTTTTNKVHDAEGNQLPANSLFLVYTSPDNSTSGYNPADPLNPTGGDAVLNNPTTGTPGYTTSAIGSTAGRITSPVPNQVWNSGVAGPSGFMYIVVFNTTYVASPSSASLATVEYGIGPTMAMNDRFGVTPLPTPQNYGSLINGMNGGAGMVLTAVPEPSSLALLGLGIACVALRRRFSGK